MRKDQGKEIKGGGVGQGFGKGKLSFEELYEGSKKAFKLLLIMFFKTRRGL